MDDKLKLSYIAPNLKVVLFGSFDVISTSGPLYNDGNPNGDDDGWT